MTTHRQVIEVAKQSVAISPQTGIRVEGSLRVPGDKSISHRAVLVGAVGEGATRITGISPAHDVSSSIEAVRALGVEVTTLKSQVKVEGGPQGDEVTQVVVNGSGWDALKAPPGAIDVQNSGTTIRVLLGILSGARVEATLTGDESIRRRPMLRVVEPLRRMGARIEGGAGGDRAPLTVFGGPLSGAEHRLEVASAQVKTALLLAGLRASGVTVVEEPARSRDHTERLLRARGVQIEESGNRLSIKSTNLSGGDVAVPGDLSSAAFLLAAAAILPGSRLVIDGVGLNPTRTGFLAMLERFGALVRSEQTGESAGEPFGRVELRPGDRRPLVVGGDEAPGAIDELPLVAVLGALAPGETAVTGARELRVKESDRVRAMVEGLATMGADVEALPDGFVVRGGRPLRGASVSSGGDHRVGMALAVAALAAEGTTTVAGWDAVGVSYPGFERDLARLVVR